MITIILILTALPRELLKETGKAEATLKGRAEALLKEADLLAQVMVRARGRAALLSKVDPHRKVRVKAKETLKGNFVRFSLRAFAIEVINVGIYTTLAMFKRTLLELRKATPSLRRRETSPIQGLLQ